MQQILLLFNFLCISIHSLMTIDILWGKHHKELTLKTIRTQRWVQQHCKVQAQYMKMNNTSISYDKQSGNWIKEAIFTSNSIKELPRMNLIKKGHSKSWNLEDVVERN